MVESPDGLIGTNRTTLTKVLRSSAISTLVNALVVLLVLPRVLDGIDVNRYGVWVTLSALLAIGQLAEGGIGVEISRRVATAYGQGDSAGVRRAVREGTTVLVGIAALLEVVGLVIVHPVVNLVFTTIPPGQRGQLVHLFIGVITLLAVTLMGTGYFSILAGLQRSDYQNWSGIASVSVGAVVTVAGIALGLGIWALLLANCAQLLVSWTGCFIGVRQMVPDLGLRLTKVSRAVVLGYIGMPAMLVLASASDVFDTQVDKLVLTHNVGPKSSAMFQIGTQVVLSGKGLALIPLGVLLAGTAELYRTEPNRLLQLEGRAIPIAQAIAAVVAGGFLVFAPTFLQLWLGADYGGAALSMRFMAVAVLFNMWSAPWFYYAVGRGRHHYVLIAASVTLAVNFVCTIILTTRIGLLGALIGSVAGNLAGTLVGWMLLRRWERRQWLRPGLRASAVVALVVGPLLALSYRFSPSSWLELVGWGAIYLTACGVVLLATRSLPVMVSVKAGGFPQLFWRENDLPRPTE